MKYIIPLIALAILSSACRRNEAKERVRAEREAWEASLPDSLRAVEHQIDSIRNEIQELSKRSEELLPAFDYIENPREVEGYYIAKAWTPSYPLKSTGLVARLTKGENLELIAALGGGSYFNRISVEANGETAETSVVPHDQALNYRMSGLNIVCFSDSAANSCAELIAASNGGDVNINFYDSDKKTGSIKYPSTSQSIMSDTWNLFETRRRMLHDERMIPMLAKKGAIITSKIESLKDKE